MIDYSMKYHIYRTHLSGYWPNNFLDLEDSVLNGLEGCIYHGLELDAKKWMPRSIILSNTHFKPENVSSKDWEKVDLILHANSGYDNLLCSQFLQNYHGPVLIAPDLRAQAVAEYNLQAWLNGLGRIPFQKAWDKTRTFHRRLAQQERVLIIGFGHVGKKTYRLMEATGAFIDVYDPYVDAMTEKKFFSSLHLITNIIWSDYDSIIVCASLTPTSRKLMQSPACWKSLKSHVIMINATRGALLPLDLAIPFAHQNPQAKIFIDVYGQEPFTHFSTLPENFFTTSHIAGVHDTLIDVTHRWHQQRIQEFTRFGGEQLLHNHGKENLRHQINIQYTQPE